MAPRGHALPNATTDSAREARKSFFCELCQKGYARMPEFEAHESSYDHQHRKRLKDLKSMSKDPNAAARARAAEQKANADAGLTALQPGAGKGVGGGEGPVKKKPVFKSTLQPHNAAIVPTAPVPEPGEVGRLGGSADDDDEDGSRAKENGWFEDRYRPEMITPCEGFCGGGCETCREIETVFAT